MSKPLVAQNAPPDPTWGLTQKGADVLNRAAQIMREGHSGGFQEAMLHALVEAEIEERKGAK